ncbi:HesB/IscA family protein [Buchnera aphidicola]|uniref:FeS assembly scaffold protein n=1 Tax=Buchnera aphidicola subsp. Cinara cedri (strain Cc) TaxID=372461 RepID=Q057Z6_BUCCC|nr:iron-sulfur cluster assembly accessory protein [Buchnera aphidicola]ABJ90553.1 FeS assembly scaffold protein [Buchnera aphidicola BCc]
MKNKSKKKKISIQIKLTKTAKKQIIWLLNKNRNKTGIKIKIKKSGCAGFKYKLKLSNKIKKNEFLLEIKNIKFFISKCDIPLINNTKIDFLKIGLNYSFKFINSNHSTICGCGESFNI